ILVGVGVFPKRNGSCIFLVIYIINTEYPFPFPTSLFIGFGSKCCRDIQMMERRKPTGIARLINWDHHAVIVVLPFGESGGPAGLENKISSQRPFFRKGIGPGQ